MSYTVSAADARTISTSDAVIYNEIDAITRQVLAASLLGDLDVTIDDGTVMTESTPTITVTGTDVGNGAVFTPGNTIVLAGTTVTFSSAAGAGTNLYQAAADINAASIAGLTATTTGTVLTLAYEPPQNAWSLTIADGTESVASLGLTAGTITATTPESVAYYGVWSGSSTDRKKSFEYSRVINHFNNLGYNILAKQNNTTSNTFVWEVYW